MTPYDLAIVGAGPAGMAAASQAARFGLSVLLLDEQPSVGGQIYRNIDHVPNHLEPILGADYLAGRALAKALSQAALSQVSIRHVPKASVWHMDTQGTISYSVQGRAEQITAKRILLATGAQERPVPIPGWTLPGVMMAGAGQILLKQSGIVPADCVLAGSGPLVYLLAAQLLRAGNPPRAIVETQTTSDLIRAQRHIVGAVRGWPYLLKGMSMLAELQRAGIKRFKGASDLKAIPRIESGHSVLDALSFTRKGREIRLSCSSLFLHMGVIPNTQLSRSLGLEHHWDSRQQCFVPVTDAWGRSSAERIFIAGDGGGIAGAKCAEISGKLAAVKIAKDLGFLNDSEQESHAKPLRAAGRREGAIRPFLDRAYPPSQDIVAPPDDDTLVCRCEEVTAGDIRRFAGMGCDGPNQLKAFCRAGMGPCQGRYCGITVSALLAQAHQRSMDETGYYRIRPPIKPVTLDEIAQLDESGTGGKDGMDLG